MKGEKIKAELLRTSGFFTSLPTGKARMPFFPERWHLRLRLYCVGKHQREEKPKPLIEKKKKKTFYIAIKGKWLTPTPLSAEMKGVSLPAAFQYEEIKIPVLLPMVSWPRGLA